MKHRINTLLFALAITLISLFLRESWFFIPLLILTGIAYLTILSLGVLFMQYNYFLKSTTRLNGDSCLVTFDDGPDPEHTPLILDILAKHDVKAIFFVVGEKVEQQPQIVKRIVSEGHLLGNHSHSHNNFTSLFSRKRLSAEIKQAQEVIESVSGTKVNLFRPPIGYTNPKYATVLGQQNLKCVGWTLRSYDSVYTDPKKLLQRLISRIKPGNIVLMHDNLKVATESLDTFLSKAKANGIIFASSSNIKSILDA